MAGVSAVDFFARDVILRRVSRIPVYALVSIDLFAFPSRGLLLCDDKAGVKRFAGIG